MQRQWLPGWKTGVATLQRQRSPLIRPTLRTARVGPVPRWWRWGGGSGPCRKTPGSRQCPLTKPWSQPSPLPWRTRSEAKDRQSYKILVLRELQLRYSLVPNVTHRSIETHACTLGKSIGLNYPHAWTNGKLLCGKKHTTNNFVSHNPIETHDFKISSCQKCDFQLNHTTYLHF